MKRDEKLLKSILQALETFKESTVAPKFVAEVISDDHPGLTFEMVEHHLDLLADRGFAASNQHRYWRLTDLGHDQLDRDPQKVVDAFTRVGQ